MNTQDLIDKIEQIKQLSNEIWNEASCAQNGVAESNIKSLANHIKQVCEDAILDYKIGVRKSG